MIIDVPRSDSLYKSGKELFNLSWQMVVDLISAYTDSQKEEKLDEETKDLFWTSVRRDLLTAFTLVVQGTELLLKGKIADVSPYLLIDNLSKKTEGKASSPKKKGIDFKFNDFFTIQESSLLDVCECVTNIVFEDDFIRLYSEMLDTRNEIIHLESQKYKTPEEINNLAFDIIDKILCIYKVLMPAERWMDVRLEAIRNAPGFILYKQDEITPLFLFLKELKLVVEHLMPAKVKEYFDFDKKERAYVCPECLIRSGCNADDFRDLKFAFLTPQKDAVECVVCQKKSKINFIATACCPGMVKYAGYCLSCLDNYWP